MLDRIKKIIFFIIGIIFTQSAQAAINLPNITVGMNGSSTPQEFSQGVQVLILLTILTLAPSIVVMTTAFVRIVIVLALTRQAIGTASLPPNQVLVGLALILTFFVMSPTISKINETAYQPYMKNLITQEAALDNAVKPLRELEKPKNKDDVPTYVLIPSFILSELKTGFKIGFIIFLPFLVIDLVVASVLVSMGMMFLPPTTIAMPFKLIMFVMVDGWYLVVKSLVEGFAT